MGETTVLIHGSNIADPGMLWANQRELAARYHLLIPDRRGYGLSPDAERNDFEVDIHDILALLGEGAHLVGHAYGSLPALLAAARRPELVYSLTLIEPPAFDIARGHSGVDRLIEQLSPLYDTSREVTPEEFIAGIARRLGQPIGEPIQISPQHRRAIRTTMSEPPPWQARIPVDALVEAPFPKLVVSGDWHSSIELVADILAQAIGAERAVIQEAGHGVQHSGKPFNQRLEATMRAAVLEWTI
jgi:pimeloyl-ACP methyl ester carboxylesterase